MTIRDPRKFCESLWDWACLRGCFGSTKIEPTDIDGSAERNGRFLYIETKLPGNAIPTGQKIYIENRVKDGISTFVVAWGRPGCPEKLSVWLPGGAWTHYPDADLGLFREIVKRWFYWANARSMSTLNLPETTTQPVPTDWQLKTTTDPNTLQIGFVIDEEDFSQEDAAEESEEAEETEEWFD